jgi:hypothetical protein
MSMMPFAVPFDQFWTQWPPLSSLMVGIPDFTSFVLQCCSTFTNEVKTIQQVPYTWDMIRVPCDLRRFSVTNMPWKSMSVNCHNIGSTLGLAKSLAEVVKLQQSLGKITPLLVDVNVYYRIQKLLYIDSYLPLNVRGALRQQPLVFGLWHGYAHCVKRTFMLFCHWWAILEYPRFLVDPANTDVYLRPHVSVLEQVIAATFLVHDSKRVKLLQTVLQCAADFGEGSRVHRQAVAFRHLIVEYIPALFTLGIAVREVYYNLQQPNTGFRAKELLGFCLNFLLKLERTHRNEYCRVLSVALLSWTPFLNHLPAACFMEEVLEASLSKLSQHCATDLRVHSVPQFSDSFAAFCSTSSAPRDAASPNLSQTLSFRIAIRIDKALGMLRSGRLPAVEGSGNKGRGSFNDNVVIFESPSLFGKVDRQKVHTCIMHALLTMLKGHNDDPELYNAVMDLCRYVPPLGVEKAERRRTVIEEAEKRLRTALKSTPCRRRLPRVRTSALPTPPSGTSSSSSDGNQSDTETSSSSSSSLRSAHSISAPSPTDPDGRSVNDMDDFSIPNGSFSYDSDDSRSAGCTSGEDIP